jgi:hypothetical protein
MPPGHMKIFPGSVAIPLSTRRVYLSRAAKTAQRVDQVGAVSRKRGMRGQHEPHPPDVLSESISNGANVAADSEAGHDVPYYASSVGWKKSCEGFPSSSMLQIKHMRSKQSGSRVEYDVNAKTHHPCTSHVRPLFTSTLLHTY